MFSLSSIFGSFRIRNWTGSILSWSAISFMADSVAKSPGTAHVGRCADVAPGPSEMHPQVWRAVMKRRRFTAILLVILEDRAVTDVIVFEREELAFRRRAEPHPLLGAGAMTSRLKGHLATEDELDRLA